MELKSKAVDSKCLCRFATSSAKEFKQMFNHVSHFCREMTLIVNSGKHSGLSSNRGNGSISIYIPDRDVSLTLLTMTERFFDQEWFLHPSFLLQSQQEQPQFAYHPCLNQYTCRALQSLLNHDPVNYTSRVNASTASAEIRIPVMCMDLQNCLRSAKDRDIVTLTVHWDDLTHYYVTVRQHATGIEVTHQKKLVKVQRVFLHKQIQSFHAVYLIKAEAFQSLLNALANVGQDDLFFIRNRKTSSSLSSFSSDICDGSSSDENASGEADCVYAIGVWNTQATLLRLPYKTEVLEEGADGKTNGEKDEKDEKEEEEEEEAKVQSGGRSSSSFSWEVCGPFKLAPLIIFCNNRVCKHYMLHLDNDACIIEGSMHDGSENAATTTGHHPIRGPNARIVMLLRRMEVAAQRLSVLTSQIAQCISREHYSTRGGPSILHAWEAYYRANSNNDETVSFASMGFGATCLRSQPQQQQTRWQLTNETDSFLNLGVTSEMCNDDVRSATVIVDKSSNVQQTGGGGKNDGNVIMHSVLGKRRCRTESNDGPDHFDDETFPDDESLSEDSDGNNNRGGVDPEDDGNDWE
jgi:hypothetical protein